MHHGKQLAAVAVAAAALVASQLAAWSPTHAASDPISDATGRLQTDAAGHLSFRSDAAGGYSFVGVPAGSFVDNPEVSASTSVRDAAAAHLARYGSAFGTSPARGRP